MEFTIRFKTNPEDDEMVSREHPAESLVESHAAHTLAVIQERLYDGALSGSCRVEPCSCDESIALREALVWALRFADYRLAPGDTAVECLEAGVEEFIHACALAGLDPETLEEVEK